MQQSENNAPDLPDWQVLRPTILQVLPALQSGGVERGTLEIAEAVIRAGGRALVASRGGRMVRLLERMGGEHFTLPLHSKNPWQMWRNVTHLQNLMQAEGVSLCHMRSRAPAWSALAACQRAHVPLVGTFHAPYSIGTGLWGRFKRHYNSVMGRGDHTIAISRYVADYVRENYPVRTDRLTMIPRSVDVQAFDPAAIPAERIAKLAHDWTVPDDMPIIMLSSRLSRIKGHDVLVEALARLKDRCLFRCLIVGEAHGATRYPAELEQKIRDLGLESHVRMVGHCADIPAALMLADVAVLPSYEPEGFGRAAVEAQAMGVPVIVPRHGAGPETVIEGETGWIFPPRDPAGLADCLEKALALSMEEREDLAQKARQFVLQNYTLDLLCARTLAIYDQLIRARL